MGGGVPGMMGGIGGMGGMDPSMLMGTYTIPNFRRFQIHQL